MHNNTFYPTTWKICIRDYSSKKLVPCIKSKDINPKTPHPNSQLIIKNSEDEIRLRRIILLWKNVAQSSPHMWQWGMLTNLRNLWEMRTTTHIVIRFYLLYCNVPDKDFEQKVVTHNDRVYFTMLRTRAWCWTFRFLIFVFSSSRIIQCISENHQQQEGMLTLELSSIVLEIPNDAYTTLSRNLIGCPTLSEEYCR